MLPNNRRPTFPGEMLLEEFLKPSGITQAELAKKMGMGVQTINMLVNGRRAVTAETAIKLSKVFGNSAEFWLGLQMDVDLWDALRQQERPHHSRHA